MRRASHGYSARRTGTLHRLRVHSMMPRYSRRQTVVPLRITGTMSNASVRLTLYKYLLVRKGVFRRREPSTGIDRTSSAIGKHKPGPFTRRTPVQQQRHTPTHTTETYRRLLDSTSKERANFIYRRTSIIFQTYYSNR